MTLTAPPQLNTTPAAADGLTILTWQERQGNPFKFDSSQALWHTDHGSHHTDANEGCRNPNVPGIYEACYDWNQNRGHFNAHGQGKRCLRQFKSQATGTCGDGASLCDVKRWHEVPCTW